MGQAREYIRHRDPSHIWDYCSGRAYIGFYHLHGRNLDLGLGKGKYFTHEALSIITPPLSTYEDDPKFECDKAD